MRPLLLIALLVAAGNGALLHWSGNPLLAGQTTPDWPYFFDFLITLPLLYALIYRPGWRRWLQMLLAFVAFDVANVPRRPIHTDLRG